MTLVTFIVPVAPHHAALAQRAIKSALAQTISSDVVHAVDEDGIGAGAMRNLLVQTVKTPFVVFLDADDEVMPNFVEQTIFNYQRGKYVYTAWLDDEDQFHEAPEESRGGVFAQGQFHTITTLMPTALFRLAGGFDENLAGLEDVDLYMKLQTLGVCGTRCEAPLMRYNRKAGKRAASTRLNGQREQIITLLTERYQGKLRMCNCGGDPVTPPPANTPQEGDILVEALYAPAKMQGPVSGRLYPRTGNRRKLYVDPRDAAARPNWWQVPPEARAEMVSPAVDEVTALANEALSQAVDDTPVGAAAVDGVEALPSGDETGEPASAQGFTWGDYSEEDKEILSRADKPKAKPKK